MGMTPAGVYQLSGSEPQLTPVGNQRYGGQMEDPRKQMLLAALGQGVQKAGQGVAGGGQPMAPQAAPPSQEDMQVNPMAQGAMRGFQPQMQQGSVLDKILGRGGQPGGMPMPGYMRTGGL